MVIAMEKALIPCEVTQAIFIHVCKILAFSGHGDFLSLTGNTRAWWLGMPLIPAFGRQSLAELYEL